MLNKKILSLCLATSMVFSGGVAFAESSKDSNQITSTTQSNEVVIEEGKNIDLLDKAFPVGSKRISYGAGLNTIDKEKVNSLLNVTGEVTEYTVFGADCDRYLGFNGSRDVDMISSVLITREPKQSGIKVNIKTPDKITRITEGQYTNAAITAGITDVTIDVASPKLVTGESALTGVYKSLEDVGGTLIDPQKTELAQEELKTVSEISDENKENKDFSTDKLDLAVIGIKQDLSNEKGKNEGNSLTEEQIRKIVEDNLKKLNLENVLSNNNINILVNYFNSYQNSSAIDSKVVADNLEKFATQYKDKADAFYNENKDVIDSIVNKVKENGIDENTINDVTKEVEESGLWNKLVEFVKSLFESLFSKNNNDN